MTTTAPEYVLNASAIRKDVSTRDHDLTILQPTDLKVKRGTTLSVVGASGSGKSTLLSVLAGLDVPSSGSIDLLGQDIAQLDEDKRAAVRAGQVGFVFQSFMLLPGLTALENVMLPAELEGLADAKERALRWLTKVGLADRADHRPAELSGGEQQRVAIARAFVTDPALVFADEPTGNLDSQTGHTINELLFSTHAEQNTTLILVTHDDELARQCQYQYRMNAGILTEVVA
ncbi:ABC transporter ATP-binding protein [Echinimonas agarilytica]|uniref:ATP-binding cassette domain-containing protein n=1 Tax=Echinimonas agarilytica TaxID=1215918 RepID=A0AA41W5S5_9GAMM|nr:ATP-binding cassette domain-containing protein [Echinimonas agarilytica]MCM2679326.1 ATP-binding cassette domain-containing protein [Echinimonas agarilytica]